MSRLRGSYFCVIQNQHRQRAHKNYQAGYAEIHSGDMVCFVPDFGIGERLASAEAVKGVWRHFAHDQGNANADEYQSHHCKKN
jgi:hypothetical protein